MDCKNNNNQNKIRKNSKKIIQRWEKKVRQQRTGRTNETGDGYLSSFGLVLDILRRADLGFDVLEVGQRLVDDAELLWSRCGRFGRGADHGHFPLLGNQAEGARGPGGPRG